MAGAELIGKKRWKEVMVLIKDGHSLARYSLDKERRGSGRSGTSRSLRQKILRVPYAFVVEFGLLRLKIRADGLDGRLATR